MRRRVSRTAFAALIAAAVMTVPVMTAAAASAAPATATKTSCPLPGFPLSPDPLGYPAALIGNLSPAAGSAVAPGATVSFLLASAKPFPLPLARDALVSVNGASVTATAGAEESGVPFTDANPHGRWTPTPKCEVPFSFTLPASVTGTARVCVTAFDGIAETERFCWSLTVPSTQLPEGAAGGIGLAALGGLALMVVQVRRRRGTARTSG